MNIPLLFLFIILIFITILFSSIIYTKSFDTKNILNTTYPKIFIIILIVISLFTLILRYYFKTNFLTNKKVLLFKGCINDNNSYRISTKSMSDDLENNGIEFSYAFKFKLLPGLLNNRSNNRKWIHIWHRGYINTTRFKNSDNPDTNTDHSNKFDPLTLEKLCDFETKSICNDNSFCNWKDNENLCVYNKDLPDYHNIMENRFMSIIQSPSVWYNTEKSELFISINTHQNPLNYISIPISPYTQPQTGIIILRKNNNIMNNTLSPMYKKHNYILEAYINGVNYSKILAFNDSDESKKINKGVPLINKGDIFINYNKNLNIHLCNLTYYNHAVDTNKILEITNNNDYLSKGHNYYKDAIEKNYSDNQTIDIQHIIPT